jgi:FAD:protein FMN transferase
MVYFPFYLITILTSQYYVNSKTIKNDKKIKLFLHYGLIALYLSQAIALTNHQGYNMEKSDKEVKSISKKHYWQILIIIFLAAMAWTYLFPKHPEINSNSQKTERNFPIMGTFAKTVIYGKPELTEKASTEVREIFTLIEKTCNIFDPKSEIYRLNKTAYTKAFKCSPLLWNVFNSSRRAYDISGGAFDVSARPLMQLWGFYRKRGDSLPTIEEVKKAQNITGLNKVIFDNKNHTVKFTVPGMSIDFGGIAKGIAVQIATKKIKEMGIRHGVVDLGGNMYCLGRPPAPKEFYIIGIRDPLAKNKICAKLSLRNQAVATSGNYERYVTIKGHHYTHIMNPKTGKPVEDMLSVSVLTSNAGDADFLSTAIFIRGVDFAKLICKANPGTGVFIVRRKPKDKSKTETIKVGNVF